MKTEELKQLASRQSEISKANRLTEFQQMLTRVTVEAALNAERDDHLGYERHEKSDESREGHTLYYRQLIAFPAQFPR